MYQTKVHSKSNVPFSWEKKPGVSKVTRQQECPKEGDSVVKLPPPPCPIEPSRLSNYDIHIPLPPLAFQTPSRSSSKKGLKKSTDDPFVAAYKECAKSTKKGKMYKYHNISPLKKGTFSLSCKNSCSVRDDNLVRVSQFPYESNRN